MTYGGGIIRFWVNGIPATGGSKKAMRHSRTGKVVVLEDCDRNASWRSEVSIEATKAMVGRKPFDGPLVASYLFYLPRPIRDYGIGRNSGNLKADAAKNHIHKPDATKLVRAAEDALTGIVWKDDAQVIIQTVMKLYCNPGDAHPTPGALIEVWQR
jgi:Holliday junction resolvase RusA-like endonuclease